MEVQLPPPSNAFEKYFSKTASFMRIPDNQYAHAIFLISSKGRTLTDKSDHSDLRDPNAFLGNYDNDQQIRYLQNDALFLGNLFEMGKKSTAIFALHSVLHNAWLFEIRLTANKGGIERRLQHSFGEPAPSEGYGKAWQKAEEKRQKEQQKQGMVPGGMYE